MEITVAIVTSKSEVGIHYSCGTQMLEVDPHSSVSDQISPRLNTCLCSGFLL